MQLIWQVFEKTATYVFQNGNTLLQQLSSMMQFLMLIVAVLSQMIHKDGEKMRC